MCPSALPENGSNTSKQTQLASHTGSKSTSRGQVPGNNAHSVCPPRRLESCSFHLGKSPWSFRMLTAAAYRVGLAFCGSTSFDTGSPRYEACWMGPGPQKWYFSMEENMVGGGNQTQSNYITISKNTCLPLQETTCNNSHIISPSGIHLQI